jgi:hypothetical protein
MLRVASGRKPKKPKTSYVDNFDRADGAIGGNWSNILSPTGPVITFNIVSNQLKITSTGYGAASQPYSVYRYDFDVSSNDHWSQYTLRGSDGYSGTARGMGTLVRCSGSAVTFYSRMSRGNSTENYNNFIKVIAGTVTTFTSQLTTGGFNQVYKLNVIGSTLQAWYYTPLRSTTDTAISSGTRGGIFYFYSSSSTTRYLTVDDWSIDDGITGGAVGPAIGHFGKTIGGRIFGGSVLT